MTARKDSGQNHETPLLPHLGKESFFLKALVNPRKRTYKGGRILPCSARFRAWRELEGLSIANITARMENRVREFGITPEYLQTRLYELEQGRFKPPTWLIVLLADTYQLKFKWEEFWEGSL